MCFLNLDIIQLWFPASGRELNSKDGECEEEMYNFITDPPLNRFISSVISTMMYSASCEIIVSNMDLI